jgi:hypothetical protein
MSSDIPIKQTKDRLWVSRIDPDNRLPSHPYFGVETQISDGEKMANEFPYGTSLPISIYYRPERPRGRQANNANGRRYGYYCYYLSY